jgi:excisionase family DNA binding protein
METMPEYLTVTEVAVRLRVSEQTVRRWIGDGVLGAVRVGRVLRIPVTALDRLEAQAS